MAERLAEEELRQIYGYAEWCSLQKSKDLWNSAGVAFWEHVFDYRKYWEAVVPWLSPGIIKEVWTLWEARLDREELEMLKRMIEERREFLYRSNVYHSGIISQL